MKPSQAKDRRKLSPCPGGMVLKGFRGVRLGFLWAANGKWYAQTSEGPVLHSFEAEAEAEAWLLRHTETTRGAFA